MRIYHSHFQYFSTLLSLKSKPLPVTFKALPIRGLKSPPLSPKSQVPLFSMIF